MLFAASMIYILKQYSKASYLKRQVQRSWIECKWRIDSLNKQIEERKLKIEKQGSFDINVKIIDDKIKMYTLNKKHRVVKAVA